MLKSKYGLSLDQFMSLLSFQNNCCAICKTEFKGTKDTHVDHCHKTKKVRGLLCFLCNSGIGKFKDNPEFLKAAIKYLQKVR